MKKLLFFLCYCIAAATGSAHALEDSNKIFWSSKHRLSIDDFTIRKTDTTQDAFNIAIIMEYNKPFLSIKSMAKVIHNYMLKNASWIDTSYRYSVPRQLRYMQDIFDINEIYIRKLRKITMDSDNKVKALKKNYSIMLAESIIRQQAYRTDILFNKNFSDQSKQIQWEETIKKELDGLSTYAID